MKKTKKEYLLRKYDDTTKPTLFTSCDHLFLSPLTTYFAVGTFVLPDSCLSGIEINTGVVLQAVTIQIYEANFITLTVAVCKDFLRTPFLNKIPSEYALDGRRSSISTSLSEEDMM